MYIRTPHYDRLDPGHIHIYAILPQCRPVWNWHVDICIYTLINRIMINIISLTRRVGTKQKYISLIHIPKCQYLKLMSYRQFKESHGDVITLVAMLCALGFDI